MKKTELKSGMIVQTEHNRYGVVELDKNRIDICYDPDVIKDEYRKLEMVSLDDVFEYGDGRLGVGYILTQEIYDEAAKNAARTNGYNIYESFEIGKPVIMYEFVAVYGVSYIYKNDTGIYPPIIIPE